MKAAAMFDLAVAQARIRLHKGDTEFDQQLFEEALRWLAYQYVQLAEQAENLEVGA